MFKVPEFYRVTSGAFDAYNTTADDGNNGVFLIPYPLDEVKVTVIASDGEGWEHVSVNGGLMTPSWDLMCFVKSLFWGPEDLVIQLHVPSADYIDIHGSVLHLWRKENSNKFCQLPNKALV